MATTVDLDWKNLSFGYLKTDYNIRSYFRNGAWTTPEMTSDETVNLHMAATGLHYGQEAFEGLKAFRGVDGQVRIFRADENGKRLASSAEYLRMAVPPLELFIDMVKQVVKANERFIPPYGTGASLYIRPVLFGSGPQVGVKPADEYLLIIFVTPVGPYYKEGFNPIRVIIDRDHDRAAPLGTGHIKAGGNYGASLISSEEAHDKGYPSVLYLDAKEKKHIDECGAANFFGIRDGRYITPKSHSVLPSITNMSLMTLAADLGLKVESRPVEAEELSTFSEAVPAVPPPLFRRSAVFTIPRRTTLTLTTTANRASGARSFTTSCVRSSTARSPTRTAGTWFWNSPDLFPASSRQGVRSRRNPENRYVAAHRKGAPFFLSVATRSGSGFGRYFCRCLGQDLRGDTARGLRMACSLLRSRWNSPRGKLSLFL